MYVHVHMNVCMNRMYVCTCICGHMYMYVHDMCSSVCTVLE
jgi:hypothetical protein